ncbi:MAG: 4'-phosphopantetheinyl transferase superfamily protein [Chthoniobacteraceae bacterium]
MLIALEHWNHANAPAPLRPGEVHLWRADLTPSDAGRETLSTSDWRRAERFYFERDRERFIASRGIQRQVLAQYLGVEASEMTFAAGAYGKPHLPDTTLRFNLSHSGDLMLLAVTHGRELGVDLEYMKANVPFETLADHYFDPEDAWDLRLLPAAQRPWKFYDIWTSTEAQLKASGLGLSQGTHVRDEDRWSMLKFTPAAGYAAAVAVEGGDFALTCWSWQE